jgi:hypothetical protein
MDPHHNSTNIASSATIMSPSTAAPSRFREISGFEFKDGGENVVADPSTTTKVQPWKGLDLKSAGDGGSSGKLMICAINNEGYEFCDMWGLGGY